MSIKVVSLIALDWMSPAINSTVQGMYWISRICLAGQIACFMEPELYFLC
jgi:hypothetical protein